MCHLSRVRGRRDKQINVDNDRVLIQRELSSPSTYSLFISASLTLADEIAKTVVLISQSCLWSGRLGSIRANVLIHSAKRMKGVAEKIAIPKNNDVRTASQPVKRDPACTVHETIPMTKHIHLHELNFRRLSSYSCGYFM